MNIYDKAHEFAKALKVCEEKKRLLDAEDALKTDDVAKKMVTDFLKGKMEMDYAQMTGQEANAGLLEKQQELALLLNGNQKAKEYLEAFFRWEKIAADLYGIVASSLATGMMADEILSKGTQDGTVQ